MSELTISSERLTAFAAHLRAEERSPGTIENYLRHIRAFAVWLDGSPVTRRRRQPGKSICLRRTMRRQRSMPCWRRSTACFTFWAGTGAG